jgi:hypothetical protein
LFLEELLMKGTKIYQICRTVAAERYFHITWLSVTWLVLSSWTYYMCVLKQKQNYSDKLRLILNLIRTSSINSSEHWFNLVRHYPMKSGEHWFALARPFPMNSSQHWIDSGRPFRLNLVMLVRFSSSIFGKLRCTLVRFSSTFSNKLRWTLVRFSSTFSDVLRWTLVRFRSTFSDKFRRTLVRFSSTFSNEIRFRSSFILFELCWIVDKIVFQLYILNCKTSTWVIGIIRALSWLYSFTMFVS